MHRATAVDAIGTIDGWCRRAAYKGRKCVGVKDDLALEQTGRFGLITGPEMLRLGDWRLISFLIYSRAAPSATKANIAVRLKLSIRTVERLLRSLSDHGFKVATKTDKTLVEVRLLEISKNPEKKRSEGRARDAHAAPALGRGGGDDPDLSSEDDSEADDAVIDDDGDTRMEREETQSAYREACRRRAQNNAPQQP